MSWVLLFLAWAILTKVAIKRYRLKHKIILLNERRNYYLAMSTGILVFIFILLFLVDPFIGYCVSDNKILAEDSPVYFWSIAIILFFTTPFIISNLICRFSKKRKAN